jgi:hypothetical protein
VSDIERTSIEDLTRMFPPLPVPDGVHRSKDLDEFMCCLGVLLFMDKVKEFMDKAEAQRTLERLCMSCFKRTTRETYVLDLLNSRPKDK